MKHWAYVIQAGSPALKRPSSLRFCSGIEFWSSSSLWGPLASVPSLLHSYIQACAGVYWTKSERERGKLTSLRSVWDRDCWKSHRIVFMMVASHMIFFGEWSSYCSHKSVILRRHVLVGGQSAQPYNRAKSASREQCICRQNPFQLKV